MGPTEPMHLLRRPILCLSLLALLTAAAAPTTQMTPDQWRSALASRAAALKAAGAVAFKGADGWYFLTAELHSYSVGPFWGPQSATACVAKKDPDPLPAILEFNDMLQAKGITLILVPVPGKITIYGDKADPALPADLRLDEPQQQFYELLRQKGLQVVDLYDDFAALRKSGTDAYCRQDTHWSPQAVLAAARRIARIVKQQPWYADAAKKDPTTTDVQINVRGDIVDLLQDTTEPKESLTIRQVKAGSDFMDSDRASPLVVMGDSHVLVYHMELLADHAGLPEQVFAETGIVPDVIAVMGSGANGPRGNLARRRDNMQGKKCVVWCFTARELTESAQGWQHIPVIR